MGDIFISHRSTDNVAAAEVKEWLNTKGHHSIFLDFDPVDGIPAGRVWEQELYQRLRSCRAVIVLCSRASMESRWVFAEVTQARALGKHVLPIRLDDCEINPTLIDRQVIDMSPGANLDGAFTRLWGGLLAAGLDPESSFDWDTRRAPYPGLRAFQEADAAVFFGRDDEIAEGIDLLNRVRRQGTGDLVMVLGASGSGKSSLVRGGIIPRLRRDRDRWLVLDPFRPSDDPIRGLARALSNSFVDSGRPREWSEIRDHLHHGTASAAATNGNPLVDLADDLRDVSRRSEATVLVIVDQLEELLAVTADEAATAFLRLVAGACRQRRASVMMTATLRSDFFAEFQNRDLHGVRYVDLPVRPLSHDRIVEVVDKPAQMAGIELDPGLATKIANDTGTSHALPLLAFTLRELYDKHGTDRHFSVVDYQVELGGLRTAIATRAEEELNAARLDDTGLDELRRALLAMVRVTDDERWVRRIVRWDDLSPTVRPVLERFVDARLLVSTREGGERTVEVAHEALFDSWDLLKGWVDRSAEALRLRRSLEQAAADWDNASNKAELGWRGDRLKAAVSLRDFGDLHLDHRDLAFIEASETAAKLEARSKHRRFQLLVTGAAVMSVLFVAATGFYFSARRQTTRANEQTALAESAAERANEQTATATAEAERANEQTALGWARQARLLASSHPELALGVAIESHAQSSQPMTEGAVIEARAALPDSGVRIRSQAHTAGVNSAAFNHVGTLIATAGADGTAKIWDPITGEIITTLEGHTTGVESVAFNHDGTRLATASNDGTAKIWDAISGEEVSTLEGHTDWVVSVAFNQDGTRLATASYDGTSRIWDTSTGNELISLRHTDGVSSVAFNHDGTRLATASMDDTARIWDPTAGAQLTVLQSHADWMGSVAFNHNGTRLATASNDGTATIWDPATGDILITLQSHADVVNSVAFSHDGTRLATASDDGTAKVWDPATGEELTATFSDPMTGDERISLRSHAAWVESVAFNDDGTRLATASNDGTAKIWNVTTGEELTTLQSHMLMFVAFNHDGTRLATASTNGTTTIWDATTAEELTALRRHTSGVTSVAFNHDGTRIATAGWDGTAKIWNPTTGEQLTTLHGHADVVRSVAFNHDGTQLATASDDGTAKIWNPTTGEELFTLRGHTELVTSVAFNHDGTRLATAGWDGTAKIWNPTTGEQLTTIHAHDHGATSVAFNHDGTRLATASNDDTAKIWDSATGEELTILRKHTDNVTSVAFNHDGTRIATASDDGSAMIWEPSTGDELTTLRKHTSGVTAVAFNHDGSRLATASNDDTAAIWETTIDDSCELIAERVTAAQLRAEMGGIDLIGCPNLRPG